MRGFDALRSLTRDRVRPFARRRSGLLLGEGAALVLLARDRDAGERRLGRLLGHASASDGAHVAAPDLEGRGLEWAIRAALAEAEVGAADIDFVSAHGTATPLNDRVEAAVLRRVLDACAERIPVNAIKGALGHTMGAAATLEAIMCLLASREGVVPHTVGLEEHDPECELDFVVTAPRAVRPRVSLSTSLGFGGCNSAPVLQGEARWTAPTSRRGVVGAGAGGPEAPVGGLRQARRGSVPPTAVAPGATLHFPYTAPSAVPAEVAIEFGLTGPYVILLGGAAATIDGLWQATLQVGRGRCRRALVLAVETFSECEELWARGRWLLRPPLVESAACALLIPGPSRATYAPASTESPLEALARARAGETLACAPLIALALARAGGGAAPFRLTGQNGAAPPGLAWEAH